MEEICPSNLKQIDSRHNFGKDPLSPQPERGPSIFKQRKSNKMWHDTKSDASHLFVLTEELEDVVNLEYVESHPPDDKENMRH